MKNVKNYLLVFLVGSIFFISCSKDDNESGVGDSNPQEEKTLMNNFKKKVESMKLPEALEKNASNDKALRVNTDFITHKSMLMSMTAYMYQVPENAETYNAVIEEFSARSSSEYIALKGGSEEGLTWQWMDNRGGQVTFNVVHVEGGRNFTYIISVEGVDVELKGFVAYDESLIRLETFVSGELKMKSIIKERDNKMDYTLEADEYLYEGHFNLNDSSGNIKDFLGGKILSEASWNLFGKGVLKIYTYSPEVRVMSYVF